MLNKHVQWNCFHRLMFGDISLTLGTHGNSETLTDSLFFVARSLRPYFIDAVSTRHGGGILEHW